MGEFSSKGNGLITKYINENYLPAKNFSSYVYLSQLTQAEALKTAIEAQRRSKPFCMGSLYWQMNDCWPAASWSTIDYYGKWKAAQYFVKKAFAPVLLTITSKDKLEITIMNDSTNNLIGTLTLSLQTFLGKEIYRTDGTDTLKIGKNTRGTDKALWDEISNDQPAVLSVKFISNGKVICSNTFYPLAMKYEKLPTPIITSEFIKDNNKITLKLKTNVLAKNVFVHIDGAEMLNDISDNYFDLLPGEEKTLYFSSEKSVEELKKALTIKTVRDTY